MRVELWPGTVLRTADLLDTERLLFLEGSVGKVVGHAPWELSRWVYEIRVNNIWVVENKQGLNGLIYAAGFIIQDINTCDVIKLVAGPVGQPLTKRIIEVATQVLPAMGVCVIRGRCVQGMRDFYKRQGFTEIGELPHYYGVGVTGYSLEKIL